MLMPIACTATKIHVDLAILSVVQSEAILMYMVHASAKGHVWVHDPTALGPMLMSVVTSVPTEGQADVHGLCYNQKPS